MRTKVVWTASWLQLQLQLLMLLLPLLPMMMMMKAMSIGGYMRELGYFHEELKLRFPAGSSSSSSWPRCTKHTLTHSSRDSPGNQVSAWHSERETIFLRFLINWQKFVICIVSPESPSPSPLGAILATFPPGCKSPFSSCELAYLTAKSADWVRVGGWLWASGLWSPQAASCNCNCRFAVAVLMNFVATVKIPLIFLFFQYLTPFLPALPPICCAL